MQVDRQVELYHMAARPFSGKMVMFDMSPQTSLGGAKNLGFNVSTLLLLLIVVRRKTIANLINVNWQLLIGIISLEALI